MARNHTNLNQFDLRDQHGDKAPDEESYEIDDDVLVQLYSNSHLQTTVDWPAMVTASARGVSLHGGSGLQLPIGLELEVFCQDAQFRR